MRRDESKTLDRFIMNIQLSSLSRGLKNDILLIKLHFLIRIHL